MHIMHKKTKARLSDYKDNVVHVSLYVSCHIRCTIYILKNEALKTPFTITVYFKFINLCNCNTSIYFLKTRLKEPYHIPWIKSPWGMSTLESRPAVMST